MSLLKKTVLLFFCCFGVVAFCYSQDSDFVFFKGLRSDYVSVNGFKPYIPFAVKSITVKDNRPDTLSIGLFKDSRKNNVRLQWRAGQKLQDFFETYFTSDASQAELYLVINHLFISNNIYKKPDLKNKKTPTNRYTALLTFQAKAYILQPGYYQGLIKIDTTFVLDNNVEKCYDLLLENVLNLTAYSIGQCITTGNFKNHPKLTKARLDSINTPFSLSALINNADSGYYASYEDFLQGNITRATVELEKLQEGCYYVYTTGKDGAKALETNIWGVKKGECIYIMNDGLLFPLYKNGNAYYWKGLFKYVQKHAVVPIVLPVAGGFLNGSEELGTKIKLDYVPCLLNNETGTRY